MAERSRDWIDQAHRDLEHARVSMESGHFEWACFAAQQAAEKAARAVYERLAGVAWGHSVTELLKGLRERTEVPGELLDLARALDRFYVPARYPNGLAAGSPKDFYTEEDAEGAVRDSGALVRFCEGLLAG
ncbi:MAG TPA: HEPN domain-containing protein [Actinomycetota bacterium]|nr:HEPN domain-containing protein [Actinomycetota bacterium]